MEEIIWKKEEKYGNEVFLDIYSIWFFIIAPTDVLISLCLRVRAKVGIRTGKVWHTHRAVSASFPAAV